MEYVEIQGAKLPLIGLGTFGMGGREYPNTDNDKADIEAIQYAISLGMTHIDTAETYGGGHTEELVGKAIRDFKREGLFITTKVSPNHLEPGMVIQACRESLIRLQLDSVDLYLIHWPNPTIPIQETIRAMERTVREGLTRFIGVSNFDLDQLKKAQQFSEIKLFTNQVEYSLKEKSPEYQGILSYCGLQEMVLTAYSPLNKGLIKDGNGVLEKLSQKYQKTPNQIALNYLISHKNVVVIPKASTKKHLDENMGSVGWRLSSEDIQILE